MPPRRPTARRAGRTRWTRWGALAAIPLALLAAPSLTHLPARLLAGCPKWVALAAVLELLSILGFIASFALVFGAGMTRRQSVIGALRALGASTVLPAGGLVGPAIGARSANPERGSLRPLVRSAIAFTILTTGPAVAALAFFGATLWLGWPAGPHAALLTLPPSAIAATLITLSFLLGRQAPPPDFPDRRLPGLLRWTGDRRVLRDGAAEAGHVLAARNWKLLGILAYYAFDNAVLWAAFRAYGHPPPIGVTVMGYLVGSLGAAVPVPGGLGAAEGGLIGALVLYGAPAAPAAGAVLLYRGITLSLALSLSASAWAFKRHSRGAQGPTRSTDTVAEFLQVRRHPRPRARRRELRIPVAVSPNK